MTVIICLPKWNHGESVAHYYIRSSCSPKCHVVMRSVCAICEPTINSIRAAIHYLYEDSFAMHLEVAVALSAAMCEILRI